MRIAHNISAINSLYRLQKNNNQSANAFKHLSSGLSINRASDDVAGMAISQKMRAQIRGLAQAIQSPKAVLSL